ncbi:Cof-type HAD-IIB family hydrolase [Aggregicoccus sp. 17bor-14]|uniref:Cof-type HAD-IIB family hydrolase n=1 Tax=Myxococcaceae TaxID=31 RepID=UPI00129C1DB5|nr:MULTISPECIES: Cof-type HAD-IIB family hydrolase [Myxococcaceae]MBF5043780.1 Cof-type HAD-IIB family hydrolase [Simulacricoccus sp. 17bor-14]MRI89534.1 Cof-type HAD-IIB family hydrolase [Aggregicoccus sp. 17bor-14]
MPRAAASPPSPVALVLADVDGTLVTRDKRLTPRAVAAVQALGARGIGFALTSGRPPRGLRMLTGPLALDTPLAAFNGGLFCRPTDLAVLEAHTLPPALLPPLLQVLAAHGLDAWLYRGLDWLVREVGAPHVAREAWTVQFAPTRVAHFQGLEAGVVKLTGVTDDPVRMEAARADVAAHCGAGVSAQLSQPYYLDITHAEANKGAVARRLCAWLGVPRERLASLGDQPNDVSMFRESGLSIAMGNAPSEVQAQASHTTASSEAEGFALALERFVLGADAPALSPSE